MEKKRKIIIIVGAVLALVAAGVVAGICLGRGNQNVRLGFYELDSETEDLFVQLIKDSYKDDEKAPAITFEHLDTVGQSVDMILMPMGKLQDKLISSIETGKKNNPSLPVSVMSDTSTSIRQKAVFIENNVVSVQLLMDNVELDVYNDALALTDTTQLQTWADIEAFALHPKTIFHIP